MTPHHSAESMRAARSAKRPRNSGKWRDWAASTASSINSSAWSRSRGAVPAVPWRRARAGDESELALVLGMDTRGKVPASQFDDCHALPRYLAIRSEEHTSELQS